MRAESDAGGIVRSLEGFAERHPDLPGHLDLGNAVDEHDLARIVGLDLAQAGDYFFHRFVPADLLPAGIFARPFFRIGAAQTAARTMRIIERHDRGVALGAELAEVVRVVGIAFDLDDDAVDAVCDDAAAVAAHFADAGNPDIVAQRDLIGRGRGG